MWSIYEIGIRMMSLISGLLSSSNPRVKLWKQGRTNQTVPAYYQPIWIHCASYGEYLQAKPLIELLKRANKEIVLSFFSPSGYERVKDVDKYYLPIDTYNKAKQFVASIDPSLVILVRSEFWFNHLSALKSKEIPVVVMNSFFPRNHYFFKFYGSWFLSQVSKLDYFYAIDQNTKQLLSEHGIDQVITTGDTKVDQVIQSRQQNIKLKQLPKEKKIILLGSVEKEDRPVLKTIIEKYSQDYLIVIVPHEPSEASYNFYDNLTGKALKKYSAENLLDADLIYVDVFGILSELYMEAWVSYIGGGFGKGIHNILEACVVGCPVVIGPNHNKFPEAKTMIDLQGAKEIKNENEIVASIDYFANEKNYTLAQQACQQYIDTNSGATIKLYKHLKEKGYI